MTINPNGITISNVLPEDVKANLAAWAQQGDKSIWAIARTAVLLAEELSIKRALLDAAIAQACGWGAARARDARSVAGYYSQAIVDMYPALSFSIFRTAMSAGELDKSIAWLEWCAVSADDYGGMVAPVDVLAAKMKSAGDMSGDPIWKKQVASAYRLMTRVYLGENTPADMSEKACNLIGKFEQEFEFLVEE